ncbi:hypothetical protein ES695_01265 [Candidatus Atribacteria bacterium 1244-E10-H5-B2]|nr:MAG: hypothetical protein ES695_01265 [Candidatus Atribacteria bacterium 1244-E10-H5-B2]
MSLSPGLEAEKALILDNHLRELKEEEITNYLDSLDLTDKLLIRDTYYLFLGNLSMQEEAISKIIKSIKIKGGDLEGESNL